MSFHDAHRRVLRLYAQEPCGVRVHIRMRSRMYPVERILSAVPRSGSILDVGCGYGYFAHLVSMTRPGCTVTGIDLDNHKIAVAQTTTAWQGAPHFQELSALDAPEGPYAAITVLNVLYLFPPDLVRRVLSVLSARLAPGGYLILLETGEVPRWKLAFQMTQEWMALRLLHLSKGGGSSSSVRRQCTLCFAS